MKNIETLAEARSLCSKLNVEKFMVAKHEKLQDAAGNDVVVVEIKESDSRIQTAIFVNGNFHDNVINDSRAFQEWVSEVKQS